MSMRRVVVTGMGVIAPNGRDIDTFRTQLEAGASAIGTITRFDASRYPSRIAAEVDESESPLPNTPRANSRIARFALAAARQAALDACLEGDGSVVEALPPESRRRTGVLVAAGLGTYEHDEIFASCSAAASVNGGPIDWKAFHDTYAAWMAPDASLRRTPGAIPAMIAETLGFGGPVMTVMTACSAGTQALGDAARWIRDGRCDVVLAGGSDSELYPMGLASFCLLGALSSRNDDAPAASRPFDRGRDGFVIGEGAGILVLEELEHARRRGARIHAEVAGFGSACDSYRVTDPHPEGRGAVLAMRRALDDAGLTPSQVTWVNAHGTSTVANDRIETRAIRAVFGAAADRVAVSSTKSMIGHLTVAAGAVEAIASVLAIESGTIHPTINYSEADPECDLDYVPNTARKAPVEVVLSNSFAFGGQCASLAMRRFDA